MKTTTLRNLAQSLFWPAVIVTIVGAVIPPATLNGVIPWDKAGHFLAFYALTLLGVAAFPRQRSVVVGGALSLFGALIEIVQATPLVHRDGDWHDWVADTVAILAVLAPMALVRWRSSHAD
jgi:hypothetical protein